MIYGFSLFFHDIQSDTPSQANATLPKFALIITVGAPSIVCPELAVRKFIRKGKRKDRLLINCENMLYVV